MLRATDEAILPVFQVGYSLTPVPRLAAADARELARIVLDDVAGRVRKPKNSRDGDALYVGKHIAYVKLAKHLRGSDAVERVYAAVNFFMRATLSLTKACKEVAKILGPKLGNSKRGRPVKGSPRRPRQLHEIVRSKYNSFVKRNPFPGSEDSAYFRDSRVEFWYSHAWRIRECRNGVARATSPPYWRPASVISVGLTSEARKA